jgi:hypothetical protein
MVSPPVQPKSILRNRSFSTSLREVPLVENDNMSINPEPPSEPPSPIEGRHKFMRQGSDSGGPVADDHREFLEKLKRKTAGGPNFGLPPIVDNPTEGHNNKTRMFATNKSRPNLTTITPVDFDEHEIGENHENETDNGAHLETNNESLNAISDYTDQNEDDFVQEVEMEEAEEEETYQEETNDFEQPQEEAEHYEERSYPPPQDFHNQFHRHPRPPRHHEPFFHPRFPPRFEHPFRRDINFPGFRDPYGGPPSKRPYHDNYHPFRRPFQRF